MEQLVKTTADIDRMFAPKPAHYVKQEVWLAGIGGEMEKQFKKDDFELRCVVQESRKLPDGNWSSPNLGILLNDKAVRLGMSISFDAERSGGSAWRRRSTGRMRCSVGAFGDRQSFPERKDGTFSYDKIALKLLGAVYAAIREAELAVQKKSNAQSVAALRAKFKLSEHDETVCASYYYRDPWGKNSKERVAPEGRVFVKLGTKTLTPEQADRLLSFIKAL